MKTFQFNSAVVILTAVVIDLLTVDAEASKGDRQPLFRQCLDSCRSNPDNCTFSLVDREADLWTRANSPENSEMFHVSKSEISDTARQTVDRSLPLSLRLFGWRCEDECKYICMHEIEKVNRLRRKPVYQYYGKWPFLRLWGIQEPASVLASILNFQSQYWAFHLFRSELEPIGYGRIYDYYRISTLIHMNGWLWSSVFHSRDLPWTEKLDYFSAILNLVAVLYVCFIRMLNPSFKYRMALLTVFASYYVFHIGYLLSKPRFDYTFNMAAGVTIGVTHNLIWLAWCLWNYRKLYYARRGIVMSIMINAVMLLEILDFPPIWKTLDAHALWHFSTVPLAYLWAKFLIADCKYLLEKDSFADKLK